MDCYQLTHGISIEKNSLHDCCLLHSANDDGRPFIIKLDRKHLVNWDKVFELKKSLKKKKVEDVHCCFGCRCLSEDNDFSKDEEYISLINFNHWNRCNSKCVYCNFDSFGSDKYFNVLPLIKSLADYKDGSYLRNYSEVTFQGGEVTVLPEFEELLTFFSDRNMKVRIHSNGIKFSKAISESLAKNLVSVVISPDTAVRETYEKIKQVDCCEKAWKNIQKYASVQTSSESVKAKFIMLAGINDTVYEVNRFVEKCCSVGLKHVIWDIEYKYLTWYKKDVPNLCMLLDYAVYKAEKAGLISEFYDGALYGLKNRSIPKTVIFDEEKFLLEYSKIRKKYEKRNIDYKKVLYNL